VCGIVNRCVKKKKSVCFCKWNRACIRATVHVSVNACASAFERVYTCASEWELAHDLHN
jgi:hypothetical protein